MTKKIYRILLLTSILNTCNAFAETVVNIPIDSNPYVIKKYGLDYQISYITEIKTQKNPSTGQLETLPFTCTITTDYIGGGGVMGEFNFALNSSYNSSFNVSYGRPYAFSVPKFFVSTETVNGNWHNSGCQVQYDAQICQQYEQKNDGSPMYIVQCSYLK